MPEARDGGLRERQAKPPERFDGPRARKAECGAQRRGGRPAADPSAPTPGPARGPTLLQRQGSTPRRRDARRRPRRPDASSARGRGAALRGGSADRRRTNRPAPPATLGAGAEERPLSPRPQGSPPEGLRQAPVTIRRADAPCGIPHGRPHTADHRGSAERLSSPAAGTTTGAAKPAEEWRSGAAPGSAGALTGRTPPRVGLRKPNPTSAPRAPSRPPAPTGLRGPSGPRAGRRVTASHGAAPPSHPNASMARGAAKAERLSSPAAGMATGVVKPADDRRSGAAPGSAGASAATPTPRDGLPRPNPTTTLRAPSRPLARAGLRGPSGPRAGGA